jgi:hypothetical protein
MSVHEILALPASALRFAFLRALLDGGQRAASDAAASWMMEHRSAAGAQEAFLLAKVYDGELVRVPSATWGDFRVAVFHTFVDHVARAGAEGLFAGCADRHRDPDSQGWKLGSRDLSTLAVAPTMRWHAQAAAKGFVASLLPR